MLRNYYMGGGDHLFHGNKGMVCSHYVHPIFYCGLGKTLSYLYQIMRSQAYHHHVKLFIHYSALLIEPVGQTWEQTPQPRHKYSSIHACLSFSLKEMAGHPISVAQTR